MLDWPKNCKLAHAFLWEYWCKRLKLAQLLGQLGVFLTLSRCQAGAGAGAGAGGGGTPSDTRPAAGSLCTLPRSPTSRSSVSICRMNLSSVSTAAAKKRWYSFVPRMRRLKVASLVDCMVIVWWLYGGCMVLLKVSPYLRAEDQPEPAGGPEALLHHQGDHVCAKRRTSRGQSRPARAESGRALP